MKQTIILLFCALTAQAAAQNNIPQEDSLKALALKGVTVKGERPRVTMKDGRFTIDMQAVRNKKIAANAHELIKELPLVSSTDGEVLSLSGAQATTVMINGKPSNLTAEQIIRYLKTLPADKVDKVELLYNPPAEYHAGNTSVINVITGRSGGNSFSGQLAAHYKWRHDSAFGNDAATFFSLKKWNFNLMYSYDFANTVYKREQYSEHTLSAAAPGEAGNVYDIRQTTRIPLRSGNFYVNASAERRFNDKSTLTIGYMGDFTPSEKSGNETASNMFRSAKSKDRYTTHYHDVSANYNSTFGLKAGASYNYYSTTGLQSMKYDGIPAFDYHARQRIDNYKSYADYGHSLGRGWSISLGAMFNFVESRNRQDMQSSDAVQDSYRNNTATYENTIDAYAGARKSWLDDKILLDATITNQYYRMNHYHNNSLMPRVSATWSITPEHRLQLSYRTFKVYPSYWMKQDYVNRTDEYSVHMGNPDLKPQKITDLSLQYILAGKYTFTVLYRDINGLIMTQTYQSPDALQLIYQNRNIKKFDILSFNASAPVKFGKVAYTDITARAYMQHFKSKEWHNLTYDHHKWVAELNSHTTFYLNSRKTLTADLDIWYVSPALNGEWEIDGFCNVKAGIKWKFLNDNAVLSFDCYDIFESAMPEIHTRIGTQNQRLKQNFYQRTFNVGFTWKFGGYKELRTRRPDTSRYGI